jgi:hypothetical protein
MPDLYASVALVHALLFLAAIGYAKFLNQPHVHAWYSPDYVWMTVVGGDMLIGLAFGALYWIGVVTLLVPALYISLHISAGLPIVAWQHQRADKRARELELIEKGP